MDKGEGREVKDRIFTVPEGIFHRMMLASGMKYNLQEAGKMEKYMAYKEIFRQHAMKHGPCRLSWNSHEMEYDTGTGRKSIRMQTVLGRRTEGLCSCFRNSGGTSASD